MDTVRVSLSRASLGRERASLKSTEQGTPWSALRLPSALRASDPIERRPCLSSLSTVSHEVAGPDPPFCLKPLLQPLLLARGRQNSEGTEVNRTERQTRSSFALFESSMRSSAPQSVRDQWLSVSGQSQSLTGGLSRTADSADVPEDVVIMSAAHPTLKATVPRRRAITLTPRRGDGHFGQRPRRAASAG